MNSFAYLVFLMLFLASGLSQAGDESHAQYLDNLNTAESLSAADAAHCEDRINVQVNGLVCDFCARALEKVVGKRKDVAGIDVDLDNGKVGIAMQPGKTLDDATVKKLITNSGYNVVAIDKGCQS